MIRVGIAGWSLYKGGPPFDGEGSHLQRYARVLGCTEINSSFYRAHSFETYAKWSAATPPGFRFAVKLPQAITHEHRLRRARRPLAEFMSQVQGLGRRLGPLLVQLPPSLEFEPRSARSFFTTLREVTSVHVVCEPRHPSWFSERADSLLCTHRVGRVAADPALVATAAQPGGWTGIVYVRLHGSPRRYWSSYGAAALDFWASVLRAQPRRVAAWCIFDNTAGGGALPNALATLRRCDEG